MGIRRWYIPLILLLVTVFVPWLKEVGGYYRHIDEARDKVAPVYSVEEIRAEYQWVREREQVWDRDRKFEDPIPASSPTEYWVFLERRRKLEDAMRPYTRPSTFNAEVDTRANSLGAFAPTLRIKVAFEQKFGRDKLFSVRPTGAYFDVRENLGEIPSNAFECFKRGYLFSIPIMFLVFCIKLRVRGLLIGVELWRLIPASVFWPIALLIYPMNVRRKEQIKWAINVASYAMSATLSIFGAGAMAPLKAQVGPSGGKGSIGKKSSEKQFSFGYGVEVYPATTGIDSGEMVSPWLSYRWSVGKGFTVSGFHFVEAGERKAQTFTNHGTTLAHRSWRGAMLNVEVGGSPAGLFAQVGPRFNLVRLPWLGKGITKAAKSVVVGRGWRVRGPTHFQENFLAWTSRELPLLSGITVATEGFMRFRVGGLAAVGEPQVLFRHKRIRFADFVTEFWMIRSDPTIRMGIQFHK